MAWGPGSGAHGSLTRTQDWDRSSGGHPVIPRPPGGLSDPLPPPRWPREQGAQRTGGRRTWLLLGERVEHGSPQGSSETNSASHHTARLREGSALVQGHTALVADGGPVLRAPPSQPGLFPGSLQPRRERQTPSSGGLRRGQQKACLEQLAARLGRKIPGREGVLARLPFLRPPPGGGSSSLISPSGRDWRERGPEAL